MLLFSDACFLLAIVAFCFIVFVRWCWRLMVFEVGDWTVLCSRLAVDVSLLPVAFSMCRGWLSSLGSKFMFLFVKHKTTQHTTTHNNKYTNTLHPTLFVYAVCLCLSLFGCSCLCCFSLCLSVALYLVVYTHVANVLQHACLTNVMYYLLLVKVLLYLL